MFLLVCSQKLTTFCNVQSYAYLGSLCHLFQSSFKQDVATCVLYVHVCFMSIMIKCMLCNVM